MEPIEVKFDQLMLEAIKNKITDIHIDPQNDSVILRRHKLKVKKIHFKDTLKLYTFLKYQANIFLESFGNLETGSFNYKYYENTYFLRYAILENRARKHGVLRILNIIPIDNLNKCGIENYDITRIRSMFQKSHGLVIFCGKTGAGKSTTLFAGLNELKDKEIFTLENPIEKFIPHLIQIECKDEDLNQHISQLLRHDPDILVIGEIRTSTDLAQAIRAALSGHLLITTLHAGDIHEVLMRLQNLNISKHELKTVLKGIVYQKVTMRNHMPHFSFETKSDDEIKDLII